MMASEITLDEKFLELQNAKKPPQTTLDEKFSEFLNAKQTHQKPHPKIQKVPENLRNKHNHDKHYSPRAVSIGPIHHDNKNLLLGDNYKFTLAAKYVKKTRYSPELLHKKIADNISELMNLFAADVLALASESLQGFRSLEEKLSWLLFVDGCFLLYLMEDFNSLLDGEEVDIEIVRLLSIVITDVVLLENQLPYLVLKLLWKNDNEKELIDTMKDFLQNYFWANDQDNVVDLSKEPQPPIHHLQRNMFLRCQAPNLSKEPQPPIHHLQRNMFLICQAEEEHVVDSSSVDSSSEPQSPIHLLDLRKKMIQTKSQAEEEHSVDSSNEPQPPIHLLDLQRNMILTKSKKKKKGNEEYSNRYNSKKKKEYSKQLHMITYRNIEDLTAIGIKLKSSRTHCPLDVDFSEGWFAAELILPEICIAKTTVASILNLTAYEMCQDFENDYGICSFVFFIDSLIDHAEDVKKLRSEGILGNLLGKDEEVADLFNNISDDLANNPFIYLEVNAKIHKHRFKKYKIWLALGYHTYFSNPWAIIGFLAGVIALVLTFLQTLFTIKPR